MDRVLIQKAEAVTKSKGGILIPEKAQSKVNLDFGKFLVWDCACLLACLLSDKNLKRAKFNFCSLKRAKFIFVHLSEQNSFLYT